MRWKGFGSRVVLVGTESSPVSRQIIHLLFCWGGARHVPWGLVFGDWGSSARGWSLTCSSKWCGMYLSLWSLPKLLLLQHMLSTASGSYSLSAFFPHRSLRFDESIPLKIKYSKVSHSLIDSLCVNSVH